MSGDRAGQPEFFNNALAIIPCFACQGVSLRFQAWAKYAPARGFRSLNLLESVSVVLTVVSGHEVNYGPTDLLRVRYLRMPANDRPVIPKP